jgi:hypothetical protein
LSIRKPRRQHEGVRHGGGVVWGSVYSSIASALLPPRGSRRRRARPPGDGHDIVPPSIFWGKEEIALDAFHHTMYALASRIAYRLLSSRNGAGSTDA